MKKLFFPIFLLLLTGVLIAQAPQSFKYQGVARDGGNLVVGSVGLQLTLYEGSPGGTLKYQERHFPGTNSFGVFSVNVGTGTLTQGDWNTIDWSLGNYFIQVELDPSGGANYVDMGTSQLLSVPFALYGEDADANPANELQTISKTGTTISLSGGGGMVEDAVNDADSNPSNEIQSISLVGSELTLNPSGGMVDISGALNTLWEESSGNTFYDDGLVGIGTTNPAFPLTVESSGVDFNEGVITSTFTGTSFVDGIGVKGISVPVDFYGIGGQFTGGYRGVQGIVNPTGANSYYGVYGNVFGGTGTNYAVFGSASGGTTNYAGYFSGDVTVTNSIDIFNDINLSDDLYVESFSSFGGTSGDRVTIGSDGGLRYYGSSSENVYLGTPVISGTNYLNNGYVAVRDASSSIQAGMYVDASGNGQVFADVKNFRIDHPEDDSKEIWYASLEGPEAGAYERGEATLVNGEAYVSFSDHFAIIGNPETMTVIITPQSADTYGLAVIEKNADGFKVKELMGGDGSFKFDWEVKMIRKGHEDFKVVRDKSDFSINNSTINEDNKKTDFPHLRDPKRQD